MTADSPIMTSEPQDEPSKEADSMLPGRLAAELVPAVYEELKEIARQRMALEKDPAHTLQPTALVNEAFVRLGKSKFRYANKAQLYRAATVAMQRILIEHARKRKSQKRGQGVRPEPLHLLEVAANSEDPETILALNDAIQRLEGEARLAADVVRHRFFGGLTIEETAIAAGISTRSVDREWAYARAWLYRELKHHVPL